MRATRRLHAMTSCGRTRKLRALAAQACLLPFFPEEVGTARNSGAVIMGRSGCFDQLLPGALERKGEGVLRRERREQCLYGPGETPLV